METEAIQKTSCFGMLIAQDTHCRLQRPPLQVSLRLVDNPSGRKCKKKMKMKNAIMGNICWPSSKINKATCIIAYSETTVINISFILIA